LKALRQDIGYTYVKMLFCNETLQNVHVFHEKVRLRQGSGVTAFACGF
jgi:hypothetical protein